MITTVSFVKFKFGIFKFNINPNIAVIAMKRMAIALISNKCSTEIFNAKQQTTEQIISGNSVVKIWTKILALNIFFSLIGRDLRTYSFFPSKEIDGADIVFKEDTTQIAPQIASGKIVWKLSNCVESARISCFWRIIKIEQNNNPRLPSPQLIR